MIFMIILLYLFTYFYYNYHCGFVGLKFNAQNYVKRKGSCCKFLVSGIFVTECVAHSAVKRHS